MDLGGSLRLPPGVSVWTGARLEAELEAEDLPHAHAAVNELGVRSAAAQGIKHPMTSAAKLAESDHRLFLTVSDDGSQALGFLKVGRKHLFHYTSSGQLLELDPLCVLDFYVAEGHQRRGLGLLMLRTMLEHEAVAPPELAWDKPTPSSLGLVAKHFGLRSFVEQPNRFVIFDEFFAR